MIRLLVVMVLLFVALVGFVGCGGYDSGQEPYERERCDTCSVGRDTTYRDTTYTGG